MGRPRTGSTYQRRGRWVARITLHREPPSASGRPTQHEEEVLHPQGKPVTQAFARAYARALQQRYDEGRWQPAGREGCVAPSDTVASWVDRWCAAQTYTEATKDRRRAAVYLDGTALSRASVAEITPRDVASWLSAIRTKSTPRGTVPAPRTLRNAASVVQRALRAAVFEGILPADPFASVPTAMRPQARDAAPERRRERRLSREQLELLLGDQATPDDRLVLYHLLALTGGRVAEVTALRWCDIVDASPLHRVVIAEQWSARLKRRAPTKTGATKEVPLHPVLGAVLDRWRSEGWERWYGRPPEAIDLIVPARGHRLTATVGSARRQPAVWRELQQDCAGAAIPAHSVHDLRRTFISLCADAGMSGDVAQGWTHAPTSPTARHLYLTPSWQRQCAEMLRLEIASATLERWSIAVSIAVAAG